LRLPNSSIVRTSKSDVRVERNDPHGGPLRSNGVDTAVTRSVINDDDVVGKLWRMLMQ
jgi:hypothetical protein